MCRTVSPPLETPDREVPKRFENGSKTVRKRFEFSKRVRKGFENGSNFRKGFEKGSKTVRIFEKGSKRVRKRFENGSKTVRDPFRNRFGTLSGSNFRKGFEKGSKRVRKRFEFSKKGSKRVRKRVRKRFENGSRPFSEPFWKPFWMPRVTCQEPFSNLYGEPFQNRFRTVFGPFPGHVSVFRNLHRAVFGVFWMCWSDLAPCLVHRSTHNASDFASRVLASQARPQRESESQAFRIARSFFLNQCRFFASQDFRGRFSWHLLYSCPSWPNWEEVLFIFLALCFLGGYLAKGSRTLHFGTNLPV